MELFAIDPGNKESAYVLLRFDGQVNEKGKLSFKEDFMKRNLTIKEFGKFPNKNVATTLLGWLFYSEDKKLIAIERVQAMGMPVGYEIFETCEWIGRYTQLCDSYGFSPHYVYRLEEKITLCNDSKAKDANIRQALIDRFAKHDFKNGKGTKANPDVFYGFKADIWAAMAVATTCMDQLSGIGHKATWRR